MQAVIQQGIEKGIEKNQREVALKLIAKGMSDQEIFEITDLPLNSIAELRSD